MTNIYRTEDLTALLKGNYSNILVPDFVHISPHDGGHLVVAPVRRVSDRSELDPLESLEISCFAIVAGKVLKKLVGANWINYQENGNWSLDDPVNQHMHIHVYGRSMHAVDQLYGEALRFPRKSELNKWKVPGFDQEQIKKAEILVKEIMEESWAKKYINLLEKLSV